MANSDLSKYMTQIGQLYTPVRDAYGDSPVTASTSVLTISCQLYVEKDERKYNPPIQTNATYHDCLIPSSVSIVVDNYIQGIVDSFGSSILARGRVVKVEEYNHWRYGPRLKTVVLEVN